MMTNLSTKKAGTAKNFARKKTITTRVIVSFLPSLSPSMSQRKALEGDVATLAILATPVTPAILVILATLVTPAIQETLATRETRVIVATAASRLKTEVMRTLFEEDETVAIVIEQDLSNPIDAVEEMIARFVKNVALAAIKATSRATKKEGGDRDDQRVRNLKLGVLQSMMVSKKVICQRQ